MLHGFLLLVDPYLFAELRVAIHTVLCLFEYALCLMGPDCAPWGMPARYTSQKNFMNALGAMHLPFVDSGNQMVSMCLSYILILFILRLNPRKLKRGSPKTIA